MDIPKETWPRRHRINVGEYYRMAEVGLLARDARVELIEGEIIDRAPIGTEHGSVVDQLNRLLVHAVGDRAIVRVQGALRLNDFSEPQPDVVLLRPRGDFYRGAQPTGADVLLVIEVSDSTLQYDREVKMPLYARHGVPEAWIVDLRHGEIVFYRSLSDGEYRRVTSTRAPGRTPLGALPEVVLELADLRL